MRYSSRINIDAHFHYLLCYHRTEVYKVAESNWHYFNNVKLTCRSLLGVNCYIMKWNSELLSVKDVQTSRHLMLLTTLVDSCWRSI